jgi:superfamily II DNA or RNA helicase
MSTKIGLRGYGIRKASLDADTDARIRTELTVTPKLQGNFVQKPPSFKVYRESPSTIYVPKSYGLKTLGVPDENTVEHGGTPMTCKFSGSLRPEQTAPVRAFLDAAHDPARRGGVVNMACAAGKTVMALYIMAQLGRKTMVVVHKDFLMQQWRERIAQFLPDARVGTVKAKTLDVDGKDILVASLQSLSMKDYDPRVFMDVGFVVFDECHHMGAEVFSRAFGKVVSKYTLGLSATLERKDGLTRVFMWHLGDVVYSSAKRAAEDVDVRVLSYFDPDPAYCTEHRLYGDKINFAKMINAVCAHAPRTAAVADAIARLLAREPERRVLVLSERRGHLADIADALKTRGATSAFYCGGMKQEDLKRSEVCQIILGTFQMVSEGFDVPGLDTLVLASPKSDVVQSVGRILRDLPSRRRHVPLIVDVADGFSVFERQAVRRRKYYRSCKYTVRFQEEDGVETRGDATVIADAPEVTFRTCVFADVDDENDQA